MNYFDSDMSKEYKYGRYFGCKTVIYI